MVPEDTEDVQAGCEARVSSAHRGSALSACERETTSPVLTGFLKSGGAAFVPNRGAKRRLIAHERRGSRFGPSFGAER